MQPFYDTVLHAYDTILHAYNAILHRNFRARVLYVVQRQRTVGIYVVVDYSRTVSAGLTIVANVTIAKSPALLGPPRSFVLNLIFIAVDARVDIRI